MTPTASTVVPPTSGAPLLSGIVVALVPALRPPETLPAQVVELAGRRMQIVVIDDGSDSDSQPIFDAVLPHATVLRHERNRGKGAALRTGFAWVAENCPADAVVVTVDADGQHLPDDVTKVVAAAAGFDGLLLGVRSDDASTPLRSRIGHALVRSLSKFAIKQRITDTQTGMRAFPASRIPWLLQIPGDRFDYEMNMLVAAGRGKVPIREVPITTVYVGNNETSHYRALIDSLRIAKGMLTVAFTRGRRIDA